jgi:hypothetical protein
VITITQKKMLPVFLEQFAHNWVAPTHSAEPASWKGALRQVGCFRVRRHPELNASGRQHGSLVRDADLSSGDCRPHKRRSLKTTGLYLDTAILDMRRDGLGASKSTSKLRPSRQLAQVSSGNRALAIVPLAPWIIYLPKMTAVSYSKGRRGTGGSEPQAARLSC